MSLDSIYYHLYEIIANALYGAIPTAGSATDLALTLVCTALSLCVLFVPFWLAWRILNWLFSLGVNR